MKITLTKKQFMETVEILDTVGIREDIYKELIEKMEDENDEVVVYVKDDIINVLSSVSCKWIKILYPQIQAAVKSLISYAQELDDEYEKTKK